MEYFIEPTKSPKLKTALPEGTVKKGRQVGMNKALNLRGLNFEGRRHGALDDARNMARLAIYFCSDL